MYTILDIPGGAGREDIEMNTWRDSIRPTMKLLEGKNYLIFEDDGEAWISKDGRHGAVFKVKKVEMVSTPAGMEPGTVSAGLALITTSFRLLSAMKAYPTMTNGKIWCILKTGSGMDTQFSIAPL